MFSKTAMSAFAEEAGARSSALQQLADEMSARAVELGLTEQNCRTVCEEQLVVENGQLVTKVVCRVICFP